MKRLIVIIKILLSTIVGFGMTSAGLSGNLNHTNASEFVIFKKGTDSCYVNLSKPSKLKIRLNDSTTIKYLDTYSFINSEK